MNTITPEIEFEFKCFCRNHQDDFMEKEELANEFMYEQRLYGEDIFYGLLNIKIN